FLGLLRSRSASSLASLILVLRSAWSFSLALCLGTRLSIFFKAARRSSAVCAFLYSASASRYWGVRLAAITGISQSRIGGSGIRSFREVGSITVGPESANQFFPDVLSSTLLIP